MAEGYPSAAQIVRELGDQGVVCLQSFFDASSVARMRKEATALLDARPVLRVEPATLDHRFPSLAQAFNSDLFREIAVGYDPKCKFLCDVVIEHDTKAGQEITDIHFDMLRSLKFMIYLSDVDRQSAAFRYCLGSHLENSKFRNRFLLMGGSLEELPNVARPSESYMLKNMEGPSGTLIVFDTDGFHSAGMLQEGRERLLIRSRSLLSGWFDHAVLRRVARLNPLQVFAPALAPLGRGASRGKAKVKLKKPRKKSGDLPAHDTDGG
jgi:hypothetical protein